MISGALLGRAWIRKTSLTGWVLQYYTYSTNRFVCSSLGGVVFQVDGVFAVASVKGGVAGGGAGLTGVIHSP